MTSASETRTSCIHTSRTDCNTPHTEFQSTFDGPSRLKKQRTEPIDEEELECAACPGPGQPNPTPGHGAAADRDVWICCSLCNAWFHCICVHLENPADFSKWYCQPCIQQSEAKHEAGSAQTLVNVLRPPRRKSKRVKDEVDYAAIQEGMPADPVGRWKKFLTTYEFLPDRFRRMKGDAWTLDWLLNDPSALSEPVLVPSTPGPRDSAQVASDTNQALRPSTTSIPGMAVPPPEMTIFDVANIVGPDTLVEVIDVASQSSVKTSWTIQEWAEYFATPQVKKQKILNVISLEVTGTPFQPFVEAPKLVRDLDWVSRDWPEARRSNESPDHSWPKVQRYVLMGVEGAYSDWHIDFAGSSVYYHVIWGQKTFLFAPPTTKNLSAYRKWCSSTRQDFDWLGHHLHDLTRVDICPGETMLIPSGWLHSVYTPKNTLVVGGNFLTDWNVATQWKLVEIEEATKVPKKFRFPHLKRLTWYVAHAWHDRLAAFDIDQPSATDEEGGAAQGSNISDEADNASKHDREVMSSLPPAKVLDGIRLVCQGLEEDVELMQDPFVQEHGDEKLLRLQKLAREAMPVQHVGKLDRAVVMLSNLRRRLERAQQLSLIAEQGRHQQRQHVEGRNGVKRSRPGR